MKIIDPHLHLFDLTRGQYHWLLPDLAPFWPDKSIIRRDFSPQDLLLATPMQLSGFVHIEAGFDNEQPWREIAWLERYLLTNDRRLMLKTIACVDLTADSKTFANVLAKLSNYSSLAGVRHILDQHAQYLLNQPQVIANLAQIARANLIFEAQLNGNDSAAMQQLLAIAQAQSELVIILNHGAFCPQKRQEFAAWQTNISLLAQANNVFIKASGWEMTDRHYSWARVKQVVDFLIERFGIERVMLASNFPLCLFSKSYADTWQQYRTLAVTTQQLELLSYQNANRIYRF